MRDDPDEEPWVAAEPGKRPLASKFCVRAVLLPLLGLVVAVLIILPEASPDHRALGSARLLLTVDGLHDLRRGRAPLPGKSRRGMLRRV